MNEPPRVEPVEPERLRRFLGYFKSYMNFFTVGTAVLPLPVAIFELIPLYEPDARLTGIIASLLCFLLIAFVFFSRQALARMLFFEFRTAAMTASPPADGPDGEPRRDPWQVALARAYFGRIVFSFFVFLLIALSLGAFFYYHALYVTVEARLPHMFAGEAARIRTELMASFVAFFALAEVAFVLMATKEFLQDTMGLNDLDLIAGHRLEEDRVALSAACVPDPPPPPEDADSD